MKKAELVFMPAPFMGHLVSMVEMAKLIVTRYERISITILILKVPFDNNGVNAYIQTLSINPTPGLKTLEVPETDSSTYMSKPMNTILYYLIESQKTHVRDILSSLARSESTQLAGFIIDMFCVTMIDLANEFEIPTYVYFAANAGFLGLIFYLQALSDSEKQDVTELNDSDTELLVPSFTNPFPGKLLPSILLDKNGGCDVLLTCARRFRETKGIMVNTFLELESYSVMSLAEDGSLPPVYPVGPIVNLSGGGQNSDEAAGILRWLDDQPPSSVVFLCFGSMGSFSNEQVKELALGLERSGHRFLWSLRLTPKGKTKGSPENSNLEEVLPIGFLERTANIGKVIGWAPQATVLSHHAVGGFVSHCGWNSILESVWFGVPVATWPLYAEQQLNAFEMLKELGMAVEIKMDYRYDFNMKSEVISAEKIESKIKELMIQEDKSEVRKKVKEMKDKSRVAMVENGSSYTFLNQLVEEIIGKVK